MTSTPPRHAWDWLGRQRLLWRHVRTTLAWAPEPIGSRYRLVDSRQDVMERLRADYGDDPDVTTAVRDCVLDDVFLGQAHRGLDDLGITNAPRGLRWWWEEIVDQDHGVETATRSVRPPQSKPPGATQLALDLSGLEAQERMQDVQVGWGD